MYSEENYYDRNNKRQDRDSERKHKHKRRRHHHEEEEESIWDIWTIIPLTLSFCLIVLSSILIYKKSHKLPFCSYDEDFNECIPCPAEGICTKGKVHCKSGFVLSGKVCVVDTEAELKAAKLALEIGKFIASNPNEYCNESIGVKYENILTSFRNKLFFNEALERLDNTFYDIHVRNNLYVSYNPVLDSKCHIYIFAKKNKESLILFTLAAALILFLFISIKSKLQTKKLIKESARNIITKLKKEKGKVLIDEFEPLQNDKMYKHWQEIIDEVESYEEVEVFSTEKGTAWKYSS